MEREREDRKDNHPVPPPSGAVSHTRLCARGCGNRPGSRCGGQGQRKLELCRVAAARWGQEGAHCLSGSLDLTAPAGVAGQVPGNSGHRWQRRKGRQEGRQLPRLSGHSPHPTVWTAGRMWLMWPATEFLSLWAKHTYAQTPFSQGPT